MTDEPIAPAPPHAGFDAELRIDWLPATELGDGLPGDVGMTVLPGKRGASQRYPGHVYRRDLSSDIAALLDAGATRLVLLVEDVELQRWSDPAIVERAAAAGLDVRRYPMPDGAAPPSTTMMDDILGDVAAGRRTGNVVVACMGGVGRTGTVVACALVAGGASPAAAIRRVRAIRHPSAVETDEQERFVRSYARARRRSTASAEDSSTASL